MGVQRHTAFIYDKGGKDRLFQIHNPAEIVYSRIRDDQSSATIRVLPVDRDRQLAELETIEPGRHELHIFWGNRLAWCGPVNLPQNQNVYGLWEMDALDITRYLDRTAMESAYNNAYPNVDYVVRRVEKILTTELARKEADWNLMDHMHFYVQDGDAQTTAKTYRYQSSVMDHLDDLAARSGIDYTVIGRELHVWDTSRAAVGQTEIAGREDFLSEPTIKKYGAELATRVIATDGQGGFGISGGVDPYYGEWDIVTQAYDAETDSVKPTPAQLRSQAQLSLKGRNPTPVAVSVPEGSSLNEKSHLFNIDVLVPGVWIPLRLIVNGRPLTRMQKLQQMQVTDNANGVAITVSLYPAAGFGSSDEQETT